MIRKISSEKGASSIMVILLLVVLLVFGIAALTTALSSARLGQKVTDWDNTYYTAEKTANEEYAEIDKALTAGCGDETTVKRSLSSLGFDTSIEFKDGKIYICYEVINKDLSISVVLSLSPGDPKSLCPVKWKEKQ